MKKLESFDQFVGHDGKRIFVPTLKIIHFQHATYPRYLKANSVQKYLWPRLCTLDKSTLYELHCQMITFGNVLIQTCIFIILCMVRLEWVYKTLNDAWKLHKARMKAKHYSLYATDEERMEHKPDRIPLEDFKLLLKY